MSTIHRPRPAMASPHTYRTLTQRQRNGLRRVGRCASWFLWVQVTVLWLLVGLLGCLGVDTTCEESCDE